MKQCLNCGIPEHKAKGLCRACYEYQRKHGKPRPQELIHRSRIQQCDNCGREMEVISTKLKLCKACYSFLKKYGIHRPAKGDEDLRKSPPAKHFKLTPCQNCRKLILPVANGLCWPCYQYKRRNGTDRPEHLYKRKETIENCTNCHQKPQFSRKMCKGCYSYWYRTGKMRPILKGEPLEVGRSTSGKQIPS